MALCQKLLSHLAAANRAGFISVHCSCSLQWCPGLGESVWYLVRKLSVLFQGDSKTKRNNSDTCVGLDLGKWL